MTRWCEFWLAFVDERGRIVCTDLQVASRRRHR